MNVYKQVFVFLEILVQLWSAVSYTVVLKQVKPSYPSVKVYRYELRQPKILTESSTPYVYHKPLLGQRIYPVAVKPGREVNYKTRVPVKKEKGKFFKVSSTTEKPALRDPRLLGLSQHLVPPVSNQIEEFSESKEEEARGEENDIRSLLSSPHVGKSFASFGQEKGRIHKNPGDWATPVPQADSENTTSGEFTPSQLYLQIRHKNTVIHVPQSEALKDAETLEELINAPRLKELSRTTHVQETYSEEGYEDAGYDHAGHIRQAQHGEVYDAKDEGRFNIKEAPVIIDYDSDLEESKKVPFKNIKETNPTEVNLTNKLEPRITRSRSEVSKTSVEYAKVPKNYKGEHKYSSRVKTPVKMTQINETGFNVTESIEFPGALATFPSYFGEMPITPETPLSNDSVPPYFPSGKKSSKYRKGDSNSTKIFATTELPYNPPNEYTNFMPYISQIDSQASPSAKSLKYSRIYSKKTKQLRLEPYKNDNIYSPPPPPPPFLESPPPNDLQPPPAPDKTEEDETINQRIVLPTIGYINSLTTAHFGKGNAKHIPDEPKTQLTDALNLTQALNYLRNNKNQQNLETTKPPTEIDIRTFEPMRLNKSRANSRSSVSKTKRDVYLMRERDKISHQKEEYEGNDESDEPHNEKKEEIAEDERKRIQEENREKEKYESDLKQEIATQEKEIIKETFKNIGVEHDVSEVFPEFPFDSEPDFSSHPEQSTATPVDVHKYPFYMSKRLPENSALRYATDPRQFPKKSGYQMEFYDSREKLIQCPDFHPDLVDLPDSNSTEYLEEQTGENPRLAGLGDKIACLRMKYFDPEPFDNPIFKESEIDYVGKPDKRQKKVQTQIQSKIVKPNKDQKTQQKSYRKTSAVKLTSRIPVKEFSSGSAVNRTLRPNNVGQTVISQETNNQHTKPLKELSFALSINNKTGKPSIIPTTETLYEIPAYAAKTYQNKSKPRPPVGWKTTYRSTYQPNVRPQPSENTKRIVKEGNCLPNISKLTALDGTENLTIYCDDVTVIQEIVKNVARLRIIPKERKKADKPVKRKWSSEISSQPDQSDWVPIFGYSFPKHSRKTNPLSRRTDEVTGLKNETTQNSSSVYVIDELKEDEKVRKGEVVEDVDHYMQMMDGLTEKISETTTIIAEFKTENSTRKKRQAPTDPVKLEKQYEPRESSKPLQKRPLARLSGLDFLTRYHKNKGKPTAQKTEDFWRVSAVPTQSKGYQNSQKKISITEKPQRTTLKIQEKQPQQKTFYTPTSSLPPTEATTQKIETRKEAFEPRKSQTNLSAERQNKSKLKHTNEPRKISPLNLIPEKVTKKPEAKASDFWKTFSQNTPTENTSVKPLNFTKIVTKVSRETSESSEKPRYVYKQPFPSLSLSTENSVPGTTSAKPEIPQYKTINRSTTPKNDDSDLLSKAPENPGSPVLYYVVNLKTGRGKWVTNYEEHKAGDVKKLQKSHKLNEGSDAKRDKRRKKPKY